jgi:hypothetical protein
MSPGSQVADTLGYDLEQNLTYNMQQFNETSDSFARAEDVTQSFVTIVREATVHARQVKIRRFE